LISACGRPNPATATKIETDLAAPGAPGEIVAAGRVPGLLPAIEAAGFRAKRSERMVPAPATSASSDQDGERYVSAASTT